MISPAQHGTCNGADQNSTPHGAGAPADRSRIHFLAPDSTVNPAESGELARELASAFGEKVNSYRKYASISAEEAAKHASQTSPEEIDRILNGPPDDVSWFDLDALAQKDADLALKRWGQIKEAGRNEIRSGYRAARAVEDAGGPWERARFLAVRAELMQDWQPRNAVERQLVDQMAQWQVLLWRWQEAMTAWTNCAISGIRGAKKGKSYEMMRLTEAEALERATEKVERIHRMYLRTLKALQDPRRSPHCVAVRNAQQVNIGGVQISVDNLFLPTGSGEPMNGDEIEDRRDPIRR